MLTERDQAFIKAHHERMAAANRAGPPPEMTPLMYRAFIDSLEGMKNDEPPAVPEVGAYHERVELRPGLFAAIAVPKGSGPFPVMVHCHGNGGIAGSSRSYRRYSRDVAAHGFVCIMPDFRLAPENPFPAGLDDCIFAVHWARDNAAGFGGDGERIAVAGDSIQGGTALAVALALGQDPGAPKPKALICQEGFYDWEPLNKPGFNFLHKAHLGENFDPALLRDWRISPINGVVAGAPLPPSVLLIVGGGDIGPGGVGALPQTLALAERLVQAGIPFQMHVVEGMIHDFMKIPHLDGKTEGLELMFDYLRPRV